MHTQYEDYPFSNKFRRNNNIIDEASNKKNPDRTPHSILFPKNNSTQEYVTKRIALF